MTVLAHSPLPATALGAAATTMPTFYAGVWRRLMAAAIDSVLILALVVGMSVTAGVSVGQVSGNVMITKYGRTTPLSEIAKPHVVVTRDGQLTTTVETTTATRLPIGWPCRKPAQYEAHCFAAVPHQARANGSDSRRTYRLRQLQVVDQQRATTYLITPSVTVASAGQWECLVQEHARLCYDTRPILWPLEDPCGQRVPVPSRCQ